MTDTDIYRIPDARLADLTSRFDKIAKRAAKLGVPAPTFTIVATREERELVEAIDYEVSGAWVETGRILTIHDVTVQGEAPKYAGWSFLAAVDRDLDEPKAPNLVHVIGEASDELVAAWRRLGDVCDHCKPRDIARGRKTLVVVEHEDGTHKVVGTTCLRDFLGHTSPERIAGWVQFLATIGDLVSTYDPDADYDEWRNRGEMRFDPQHTLALTSAVIEDRGWTPKSQETDARVATANIVRDFMEDPKSARERWGRLSVSDTDRARAEAALAWAEELESKNDYLLNVNAVACKAGWRSRDLGIGCSILRAHQRELEFAQQREAEVAGATEPCPTGRATIEGVVLGRSVEAGWTYGSTVVKIRVRDDRGFIVYGTAPSLLADISWNATTKDYDRGVEVGDRVRFSAQVEPKRGETHFGYYKRPTKPERLWEQEVPA